MSVGLYYPIAIFSCYIIAIAEWGIRKWLIRDGNDIGQFPVFTYLICGSFFIAMGFFQWHRYRLWIYPVLGILFGILCIQGGYAIPSQQFFLKATYFINLIVIILFVIFNWPVLYGQERYELNSRRLFRLAVEQIRETADGFTGRPFAAGEITATREEILGFSRFLEGKYVARVFYDDKTVCFAFSMNRSLFASAMVKNVSHLCISENGNITVSIHEADYRQYRQTFNFNQLCESMGTVFKRFFEYYRQGLENRIISELKAAR